MTTNVFKSFSQKLANREILLMASSWKRETQREIPSYGNLTATMTTVVVGSLLRICKDWRGNDRFWKLLSFTCIHVSRVSNSFISKCYYVIITEWRTVSFGSSNSWWVADSNRKTDRQREKRREDDCWVFVATSWHNCHNPETTNQPKRPYGRIDDRREEQLRKTDRKPTLK